MDLNDEELAKLFEFQELTQLWEESESRSILTQSNWDLQVFIYIKKFPRYLIYPRNNSELHMKDR